MVLGYLVASLNTSPEQPHCRACLALQTIANTLPVFSLEHFRDQGFQVQTVEIKLIWAFEHKLVPRQLCPSTEARSPTG